MNRSARHDPRAADRLALEQLDVERHLGVGLGRDAAQLAVALDLVAVAHEEQRAGVEDGEVHR